MHELWAHRLHGQLGLEAYGMLGQQGLKAGRPHLLLLYDGDQGK